jgi:hypothetical protein
MFCLTNKPRSLTKEELAVTDNGRAVTYVSLHINLHESFINYPSAIEIVVKYESNIQQETPNSLIFD